jgi:hypothetical protein
MATVAVVGLIGVLALCSVNLGVDQPQAREELAPADFTAADFQQVGGESLLQESAEGEANSEDEFWRNLRWDRFQKVILEAQHWQVKGAWKMGAKKLPKKVHAAFKAVEVTCHKMRTAASAKCGKAFCKYNKKCSTPCGAHEWNHYDSPIPKDLDAPLPVGKVGTGVPGVKGAKSSGPSPSDKKFKKKLQRLSSAAKRAAVARAANERAKKAKAAAHPKRVAYGWRLRTAAEAKARARAKELAAKAKLQAMQDTADEKARKVVAGQEAKAKQRLKGAEGAAKEVRKMAVEKAAKLTARRERVSKASKGEAAVLHTVKNFVKKAMPPPAAPPTPPVSPHYAVKAIRKAIKKAKVIVKTKPDGCNKDCEANVLKEPRTLVRAPKLKLPFPNKGELGKKLYDEMRKEDKAEDKVETAEIAAAQAAALKASRRSVVPPVGTKKATFLAVSATARNALLQMRWGEERAQALKTMAMTHKKCRGERSSVYGSCRLAVTRAQAACYKEMKESMSLFTAQKTKLAKRFTRELADVTKQEKALQAQRKALLKKLNHTGKLKGKKRKTALHSKLHSALAKMKALTDKSKGALKASVHDERANKGARRAKAKLIKLNSKAKKKAKAKAKMAKKVAKLKVVTAQLPGTVAKKIKHMLGKGLKKLKKTKKKAQAKVASAKRDLKQLSAQATSIRATMKKDAKEAKKLAKKMKKVKRV